MKIYHVNRNDGVGYDEYDSAVVIAESPEQAIELLKKEHTAWDLWGKYDVTITEVIADMPRIVIESFNAG